MPDVQNSNLSKIIKRLELIKSRISLDELSEVEKQFIASIEAVNKQLQEK